MRTTGGHISYGKSQRESWITLCNGFPIEKGGLTGSRRQLVAIASMTPLEKQFVGTLTDTEAAIGYFSKMTIIGRRLWVAYLAVKMKHRGDLDELSGLMAHGPPSRSLNKNTITNSLDLRWSVQVQGVVAHALLREVRPFMFNEKAKVEADCILEHGPVVTESLHPFVDCGGIRVKLR